TVTVPAGFLVTSGSGTVTVPPGTSTSSPGTMTVFPGTDRVGGPPPPVPLSPPAPGPGPPPGDAAAVPKTPMLRPSALSSLPSNVPRNAPSLPSGFLESQATIAPSAASKAVPGTQFG